MIIDPSYDSSHRPRRPVWPVDERSHPGGHRLPYRALRATPEPDPQAQNRVLSA